ncbi:hypothetical protein QFZ33_002406 [Arthrobacter globiformis]|nr:hypothetical protein [Arthrobacter globiformis]
MGAYRRPLSSPVLDWNELTIGDNVIIVDRRGNLTPATVDTLNDDGTIVWLKPQHLGHRTLHLRTDPIMLHRIC